MIWYSWNGWKSRPVHASTIRFWKLWCLCSVPCWSLVSWFRQPFYKLEIIPVVSPFIITSRPRFPGPNNQPIERRGLNRFAKVSRMTSKPRVLTPYMQGTMFLRYSSHTCSFPSWTWTMSSLGNGRTSLWSEILSKTGQLFSLLQMRVKLFSSCCSRQKNTPQILNSDWKRQAMGVLWLFATLFAFAFFNVALTAPRVRSPQDYFERDTYYMDPDYSTCWWNDVCWIELISRSILLISS